MLAPWTMPQETACFDATQSVDQNYALWKAHMINADREFKQWQLELADCDLTQACSAAWRITDHQLRTFALLSVNARKAYHAQELDRARPLYHKAMALWSGEKFSADAAVSGLLAELSAIEFLMSNYDSAQSLLVAAIDMDEKTIGLEHELCKEKRIDLVWLQHATELRKMQ